MAYYGSFGFWVNHIPAAIVQKFSIQYTMNPAPGLKAPFIGTPKARLMREYQSDMTKYDPSDAVARNASAEERRKFEPIFRTVSRRIWKTEKAKVRS